MNTAIITWDNIHDVVPAYRYSVVIGNEGEGFIRAETLPNMRDAYVVGIDHNYDPLGDWIEVLFRDEDGNDFKKLFDMTNSRIHAIRKPSIGMSYRMEEIEQYFC